MATDQVKPSPAVPARASESPSHDHGHQRSVTPAASPAKEEGAPSERSEGAVSEDGPPLPDEEAPPLPDEPVPDAEDDGWEHRWSVDAQTFYFYNNKTGVWQWENPRVPEATASNYAPYHRFANEHRLHFPFRI